MRISKKKHSPARNERAALAAVLFIVVFVLLLAAVALLPTGITVQVCRTVMPMGRVDCVDYVTH